MKPINISIDKLKYLKEKHKKANERLSQYYDLEKIREELEYLLNGK